MLEHRIVSIETLSVQPFDLLGYSQEYQHFLRSDRRDALVSLEQLATPLVDSVENIGCGIVEGGTQLVGLDLLAETRDWVGLLFSLPLPGSLANYEVPGEQNRGYFYPGREAYRKNDPDTHRQFFHYGLDMPLFFPHTDIELETLSPDERRFFVDFGTNRLPEVHKKMRDVVVFVADVLLRHHYGFVAEDGKTGFHAGNPDIYAGASTTRFNETMNDPQFEAGKFVTGNHRDSSAFTGVYGGWKQPGAGNSSFQQAFQVKTRTSAPDGGRWVGVQIPSTAILFQIGYTWEQWEGHFRKEEKIPHNVPPMKRTYHRVANLGVQRNSYAMFVGPKLDHRIGNKTAGQILADDFDGFIGPESEYLPPDQIELIHKIRQQRERPPVR